MLTAELTVLVQFKSVRVILLILDRVVISLLAFAASECNFYSHIGTSVYFCEYSRLPLGKKAQRGRVIVAYLQSFVKFFSINIKFFSFLLALHYLEC